MANYPVRIDEAEVEGAVVKIARVDQEQAGFAKIVDLCGDFDGIDAALAAFATHGGEVAALGDTAFYIISAADTDFCKVGISDNPVMRIRQLQTGSPTKLYVAYLFWMPRHMARRLERLMLDVMAYRSKRMSGEWVSATPRRAAEVAAGILAMSNATFSSSMMFCQNLRNVRNLSGKGDEHSTRGWARVDPEEIIITRLDDRG